MSRLTPIIFILLAVRNTDGAVTPVVTLSPNWSNVYSGDRVTLSCSVGSVEEDKPRYYYYTWYKDGKVYMNEKSRTFTAKVEDSGVYRCSVRSGIYSNPVRLHVFSDEGAVTPVVTLSPNWNSVYSGDQVTLSCSVGSVEEDKPGDYYYTWYKDGKVYIYEKSRTFTAKVEDSGVYNCSVRSGIYSYPVQLHVISDDVLILQTPPDIIEGDSLSLRCHSKNKDNDIIYYYMNEQWRDIGDTLHIPNITTAQTGMYKCGKQIQISKESWTIAETYITVQDLFTSPKIKNDPDPLREGDDMTVRCDTKLNPLRGGTELHFAFSRDGRTVRGYDVSDTYRVRSSQLEDSGNYTCEVRTVSDTVRKMSEKLSIQIQRAAVRPVVTLSPNWNQFYRGDSVTLSCSVESVEVNSYWYKGEQGMYWTQSKKYKITAKTTEMYKCSVDDKVYSHPVRLSVIDNGNPNRAVVTLSPQWGTMFENEMIIMTCNTAKKALNYDWKKDGKKIREKFNQELQIISSKIQDSGDYQCSSGVDLSSIVRLEVISKAHLILQAPPDVVEGDSFHLRCHSLPGYGDEIVTLFYKDNEQLEFTNDILHIQNVNTAMSGMYKCKKLIKFDPQNDEWIWAETYISVQDHFTTPKIDYNRYPIEEGGDMTLTCDTRHNPLRENTNLKFAFYRDGQIVQDFSKDATYRSREAQLEDSGNYTCEVRTVSYTVRKNSNVVSILIRANLILQISQDVVEGDSLRLRCHSEWNYKTETTYFYKGDTRLDSKDNILQIPNVTMAATGKYRCEKYLLDGTNWKSAETDISVQELFPTPEIRTSPYSIQEGDEMTVTCHTTLNPLRGSTELHFAFYRDGQTVQQFCASNTYRVPSAQLEDSGNYTCEVRTRSDTVRKNSNAFPVQIQELFTSPEIRVDPSRLVEEGKQVTLECMTNPKGRTRFLYTFYKDNQSVQSASSKTNYVIGKAEEENSGSYQCSVQSRDGKVRKNSINVHILVQSPISGVSITVDKDDFVHVESLTLNCSIEKGTSPVFLWFHNETVVDQNSKFYQLRDNGTVLYIQSLQSHHTGTYRCQVSNKLSASKSSFVVEAFQFSQLTEKPSLGSIWPVLGVLLLLLLFVIILLFVKRRKLSLLFPSLHRQQNQQNSESTFDKDRPQDDGRSANEGANGPDETDNIQHLYGNVSSQEEDDICYTYIDISKIQVPTNKKDEPSVVYSVIQPPGAPMGSQATQEKDDSANIYQNFNAERH